MRLKATEEVRVGRDEEGKIRVIRSKGGNSPASKATLRGEDKTDH